MVLSCILNWPCLCFSSHCLHDALGKFNSVLKHGRLWHVGLGIHMLVLVLFPIFLMDWLIESKKKYFFLWYLVDHRMLAPASHAEDQQQKFCTSYHGS